MELIQENKKSFIILGVLIILSIIVGIASCTRTNKYISTKASYKKSKLPYVKIDDSEFDELNEYFKNEYDKIIDKNDGSYFTYEYNVENDIFSLLTDKKFLIEGGDIFNNYYGVYTYDLREKKFLTNEEILNIYGINEDDVKELIENSLKEQYEKEAKEGYFDKREYSYEYFLQDKNYIDLDTNVKYFIKKKKVYAYLNVNNTSVYYIKDDCPTIKKIYKLN